MSAHQIEDRIKRVLTAWKDWSLFPFTFTAGLEAMFYLSESELQEIQSRLLQLEKKEEEADESMLEQEYETWKKKTRSFGLFIVSEEEEGGGGGIEQNQTTFSSSLSTIIAEMKAKIAYVERYMAKKYGLSDLTTHSASLLGVTGTMEDAEPTEAIEQQSNEASEAIEAEESLKEQRMRESERGEEDDDVDGIPVDDVDGVPLEEDLDGEPLEEGDIDGQPLEYIAEDIDGLALSEERYQHQGMDIDGHPMK